MIGRRPFLIGCGGAVAMPVLAQIAPSGTVSTQSLGAALPAAAAAADDAASTPELVLRIHGWDTPDDLALAPQGQVWVQIDSSWRATWR